MWVSCQYVWSRSSQIYPLPQKLHLPPKIEILPPFQQPPGALSEDASRSCTPSNDRAMQSSARFDDEEMMFEPIEVSECDRTYLQTTCRKTLALYIVGAVVCGSAAGCAELWELMGVTYGLAAFAIVAFITSCVGRCGAQNARRCDGTLNAFCTCVFVSRVCRTCFLLCWCFFTRLRMQTYRWMTLLSCAILPTVAFLLLMIIAPCTRAKHCQGTVHWTIYTNLFTYHLLALPVLALVLGVRPTICRALALLSAGVEFLAFVPHSCCPGALDVRSVVVMVSFPVVGLAAFACSLPSISTLLAWNVLRAEEESSIIAVWEGEGGRIACGCSFV